MKLTNVRVNGFGVWSGLELERISDRVTVLYGANEAGKTTLMQFIRAVLYGLSAHQRQRYLPPLQGEPAGGSLDVDTHLGRLTFSRQLSPHVEHAESDSFVVLGPDGVKMPPDGWRALMADVDERTFQNVFAVGLRELQELGTLDDTEAAQLLYKLSTGLDRVSLFDVMHELDASQRRLFDLQAETGRIQQLAERREQLERSLDPAASTGHRWAALLGLSIQLQQTIQDLGQQRTDLQQKLTVHEVAGQAKELWRERRELQRRLEKMPPLADISDNLLRRLEKLRRGREERKRQIEELKQRRFVVRQQAASQPINRAIWSQAIRIEGLAEHGPWITSLESQLDQLRVDIRSLESQLGTAASSPRTDEELPATDLPDVAGRELAVLREPARALREEKQRRDRADEEIEAARQQLEQLSTELETELLEQGHEQLSEAVQQVGTRVTQLRRQSQLQDQLERLVGQQQRLQNQHQDLLEGQVLSVATLVWLGVPFVIGAMLILGGLIWPHASTLGWPVALLGLVGWAGAVIAKITLERAAARELTNCEKQLAAVAEQIEEAELELKEIGGHPPSSHEPHDAQLAAAEEELARLENLLPKEATVQAVRQRMITAQRRKERLDHSVQELQGRWKAALRQAGLPDNLSPRAAKQLATENRQSGRLRRQLQMRREEFAARERELAKLQLQIEETAQAAQLPDVGNDPQTQIRRLTAALADQQSIADRRQQLRQQDREIRQQGQRLTSQVRRIGQRIEKILFHAKVASEAELRRIVTRNTERMELQDRAAQLDAQFHTIASHRCGWEEVENYLRNAPLDNLEAEQQQMASDLQRLESELGTAHQQLGEIKQEAKSLQTDTSTYQARMALDCVQVQLREALQQWQVLAVTRHLLETVREVYETERQPQTLCDASHYFSQLTDNKYSRIWTPLSEHALRVDTADGKTLPLELLSCGTREAVFLSLRLALIVDFARRGVVLPLILDDVLVNFDRKRAACAAHVLNRFAASGHQVLLFTCHEHILELFSSQAAEVRYLPDYESPHEPAVVPFGDEQQPVQEVAERDAQWEPIEQEDEEIYDLSDIEYAEYDESHEDDITELDAPWPPADAVEDVIEDDDEIEEVEVEEELDVVAAAEEEEEEEEEEEDVGELEVAGEFEDAEDEDTEDEAEIAVEAEEEAPEEEDDEEEEDSSTRSGSDQQFAWESPERWWSKGFGSNGEAAA